MPDLNAFLWPQSVAVIGASSDTTGLRGRIMRVITSHDYAGAIYPISRSETEIMGRKAYPTVGDVPGPVDLAVLIIPAQYVPDALEQCGNAGVRAAQIIASGFAEETGETGAALQAKVRDVAARYDMAVCGPNSVGFANLEAGLCATFSPAVDNPEKPLLPVGRRSGLITVVAQSGGLGFSFYDRGRPKELPFNYVVTTGNEACLNSLDLVDHMLDEDRSEVFILFLEDLKQPARFAPIAEKALKAGKPLIVAKIGKSDAGRRAAASHTAAMAGAYSGYRAMFDRYGIIEGTDIEQMVDVASGFSLYRDRLPAGNRVGIFTPSGGAGGWMADGCVAAGLEVPELDAETRAAIAPHLPPYGATQNPVDVTAQAIWQVGHAKLAEIVGNSAAVDSVIVVTSARNAEMIKRDGDALASLARRTEKPILFSSYTLPTEETVEAVTAAGYPLFTNLQTCAQTMAHMARYRAFRERFLKAPAITTSTNAYQVEASRLLGSSGAVLCEADARPVLAGYGLPIGDAQLVDSAERAAVAARRYSRPVALKAQSPDILHKTEAGAVSLGLDSDEDVRAAFETVCAMARAHHPDADIRGVLVQPMAPPGLEMILGVNRDETFGPLLMIGFGGVHTEVLGDVLFSPVPLDPDYARTLLDRLRLRPLLDGVRGAPRADVEALVEAMVALSQLAADHVDIIDQVDLNPVIVHGAGEGLSIVDALIVKR